MAGGGFAGDVVGMKNGWMNITAKTIRTGNGPDMKNLLMTIAIVLLVLWLLAMTSSYTLGGAIHLLLVTCVILVLIGVISGRRPV